MLESRHCDYRGPDQEAAVRAPIGVVDIPGFKSKELAVKINATATALQQKKQRCQLHVLIGSCQATVTTQELVWLFS